MIKLTENFRVDVTTNNHILERLTSVTKEKTKEIVKEWQQIAFYGSLTAAINGAMKEDARNAQSLREVIERIDNFENTIKNELKGV